MNQQIVSTSDSKHGNIGKGRTNCNCVDKVPDAFAAHAGHTVTEAERTLTNVILSKLPIRIRNIVKQSTQESSFLEELMSRLYYGSKEDTEQSISVDHTSFCNKQGLQQKEYFKLNNQIPWDNRDHEAYVPGFQHTNVRLPYNPRLERSTINKYYTHSSQEGMNRMSDICLETHHNVPHQFREQSPGVVVLSLFKPISTNLIWQALAVNRNMQQDALSMLQENNGNEVKPIQDVKKNVFTSRGWGARGMPFNVLYMYSHQHKKPVQMPEGARAERLVAPAPLQDFRTASQDHQAVWNALSSGVTAGSNGGGGAAGAGGRAASGGGGKSPLSPRWYYSIIPHLHATYGWGQRGK
jgi:hypothetical protein